MVSHAPRMTTLFAYLRAYRQGHSNAGGSLDASARAFKSDGSVMNREILKMVSLVGGATAIAEAKDVEDRQREPSKASTPGRQ